MMLLSIWKNTVPIPAPKMLLRTDQALVNNREKITHQIASFWNQVSEGWRLIWGQHIHHGYYEGSAALSPAEAQHKLMEKLADFSGFEPQSTVLDAGCGMGGSSCYLAERYAARVTGITLSTKQVALASAEAHKRKLEQVHFQIEDALNLKSFAPDTFDAVWSLESCEQFYDKRLFLQEAFRVLKPGGKLMLATWCSSADEYQGREAKKYKKLCQAFDLPYMPSIAHYLKILSEQGFQVKQYFDWSAAVEPSWAQGISLTKAYSFLKHLTLAGWRGLRFVGQLRLMQEGFESGQVKYGVFFAEKR